MFGLRRLLPLAAIAAVMVYAAPAPAQTIVDEWQNVKAPPVPELKAVTVDPKTTALLMNDFVKQACNQQRRPRCLATLPNAKKVLAEARAKNMLVIYSIVNGGTIGDTLPEVAPTGNEPVVQSGVDKFYKTNLEQILKDKDIKTRYRHRHGGERCRDVHRERGSVTRRKSDRAVGCHIGREYVYGAVCCLPFH